MKVSIITACYNSSATILDCIESVNNQTYLDIEHIFIDGLSSDKTIDIIKSNSKRNPVILSENDKGIYYALNKGLSIVSGDIIGFVHSDDLISSSSIIFEIVKKIKLESVDGLYGDLNYVDKMNTNKVIRFWKSQDFKDRLLFRGWMPAHPTLFLKKKIYEKYGNFDTSYMISSDYDFMLRIFKINDLKFSYMPKVITEMRVGGISNHGVKNLIRKTKEDYRTIRSNKIGGMITVILKNTSKIKQFFFK